MADTRWRRNATMVLGTVFGAAAAVVTVRALHHQATQPPGLPTEPTVLPGPSADPGGADALDQQTSAGSAHTSSRRLKKFCSVVLPPALVATVIFAPLPHVGFVPRLLIVGSVQLVLAGLLRRTDSGRSRWITITYGWYVAVMWLGSAFVILGQLTAQFFFFQDQDQLDPETVLVLVVVGIFVLCIPAVALVAQAEFRPVIEPALFAAVGIIIGALCFPAIGSLTRTASPDSDSGSVTLYVSGSSGHFNLNSELELPGIGTGRYGGKTIDDIEILGSGTKPYRWALVLRGGARLTGASVVPSRGAHVADLGMRSFEFTMQRTQLISGEGAGGFISSVIGESVSTFASDTASRRTVVLPAYRAGGQVPVGLKTETEKDVLDAIGGSSSAAPVKILVDAGTPQLQETITSVSPTPDAGTLRWHGDGIVSPSFTLVDADRADLTQNVVFTIAVLLGVSGSALLMAIQSSLSVLGSKGRTESSEDSNNVS